MNQIRIYSYAKINLSLDVKGILENGYHEVEMVMQGIDLCDQVVIKSFAYSADEQNDNPKSCNNGLEISLGVNKWYLPKDERNIAYKAAILMGELNPNITDRIRIDIKKKIPVGAGLAGGSGNGAAVVLGLNKLWNLNLPLKTLMKIGGRLGADVPFCVMVQAKMNKELGFADDELATTAAFAEGPGTELTPIIPIKQSVALVKPKISVSTKEVYQGIDDMEILTRPDNKSLINAIKTKNTKKIRENMVNVLELYTLNRYSSVKSIKNEVKEVLGSNSLVMMTGSGPTIYALTDDEKSAMQVLDKMRDRYPESFLSRTLVNT